MGLFRRLFRSRKPGSSQPNKDKRRWSFARSSTAIPPHANLSGSFDDNLDANKHAIAVAAATAAVAEAALVAAQAAAEVVRLTSGSASGSGGARSAASGQLVANHHRRGEVMAAVKIQSAFRGYLARRALRALKALVKLQALVRGHIVRKQTADMLRRMQALVRVQARARATRSNVSRSWHSTSSKSSLSHDTRCGSNSDFRDTMHLDEAKRGSYWLEHWMEESFLNNNGTIRMRKRHTDDERSDKILEVDTWKPHMKSHQSIGSLQMSQQLFSSEYNNHSFTAFDFSSKLKKATNHMPAISSEEISTRNFLKFPLGKDEAVSRAVENGPHVFSPPSRSRDGSNGRRGNFTPRSESSWTFFNGYSGYPNYMANTESFQAKVRSQSAPRQRLEFEKYGSSKMSVRGYYETDTISESGFAQHASFRNRAYPVSGRLNSRLGTADLR